MGPKPTPKAERPMPIHAVSNHIRALSYLPPAPASSTDPDAAAAAATAPTPTAAALDRATALFLRPAPRFLYSAPRFLNLPLNTRIPEVCILGRSNVGKSTLLNALAGLEAGGKAGRSHGARPHRLGLAITSTRAGCTTMMNGYGFGPPQRLSRAPVFGRLQAPKDAEEEAGAAAHTPTSVVSRSQKRARTAGEPVPTHRLVLLDMPGYGFMSRAAWGVEIAKYLERRATLRGAVLLVDAVAGLSDGDRQVLAMLRDANVRTLVVLTKADKLLPTNLLRAPRAEDGEAGEEGGADSRAADNPKRPEPAFQTGTSDGERALRATCLRVWDALRATERAAAGALPWMQGQGWTPEICVTGAGDPRGGGFGVAGARLAIGRLAGLVPQAVSLPSDSASAGRADPAAAQTVVPFDDIQWSATATEATIDQAEEQRFITEQGAARTPRTAKTARTAWTARSPTTMQAVGSSEAAEPGPEAAAASAQRVLPTGGRRRPWARAVRRTRS